ncbi:hypothetical protein RQM47_16365 [Rubrivirga sp. S365]|uniref:hypothetical protein n=1 Tax=Rubrivirga sp. S365 TaxID=3076080 RepID=UPI0028C80F6B|nr:hypothetical protein [Rubrivirga sp. S365]MDT7858224.1 hypothetical protein [Rubrivirga sp. S365]
MPDKETAVFAAGRYGLIQPRRTVTAKVIVELGLALVDDPGWRPGFTEVWDLRFAPVVDLVPADVPTMLDLERRTKEALAGSATLIVTAKPLIFYSVKFYARLARPFGREVTGLETAAEAAAALGVDVLPDLHPRP